jgi:ElaB/YqjD/DUF883 family membrane-anchored ribosome-binding protein
MTIAERQTRRTHATEQNEGCCPAAELQDVVDSLYKLAGKIGGAAGATLEEIATQINRKSNKTKVAVQEYVTEKPLKALGIAAVAGIVIGWLLHR